MLPVYTMLLLSLYIDCNAPFRLDVAITADTDTDLTGTGGSITVELIK